MGPLTDYRTRRKRAGLLMVHCLDLQKSATLLDRPPPQTVTMMVQKYPRELLFPCFMLHSNSEMHCAGMMPSLSCSLDTPLQTPTAVQEITLTPSVRCPSPAPAAWMTGHLPRCISTAIPYIKFNTETTQPSGPYPPLAPRCTQLNEEPSLMMAVHGTELYHRI